jgi:hypothetical protein
MTCHLTSSEFEIFSLISFGVEIEPEDPVFKPHTFQKRRTKFQSSTRRAEPRIN